MSQCTNTWSTFVRKGTTVEVIPSVDLTIHSLVLVPSEEHRTFCRTSLLLEYVPKGTDEPTTITIGSLYPDENWIKQQILPDKMQPLPIRHTGRGRPQESCRCNLILSRNASYRFSIRGDKHIIQLIGTFVSPHDGYTKVKVHDVNLQMNAFTKGKPKSSSKADESRGKPTHISPKKRVLKRR